MSDETQHTPSNTSGFDINQVIETAKQVIVNPVAFYRSMPQTGGLANPIIFVAVMAFATAVIGFVLSLIGLGGFNRFGGGFSIFGLVLLPIGAIIGSFIGAAILFVIWKLMGSDKDFEVAYRCLAFSCALLPIATVIQVIPYLGGAIQTLWGVFLMYIASLEVHKLKAQTAQIVFGILAFILVVSGFQSERTARKWSSYADRISAETQRNLKEGSLGKAIESMQDVENMTPEEAGEQMGEFLKGLEDFAKGLEQSLDESETEVEPE